MRHSVPPPALCFLACIGLLSPVACGPRADTTQASAPPCPTAAPDSANSANSENSENSENSQASATLPRPVALEVNADDGHHLRLWYLSRDTNDTNDTNNIKKNRRPAILLLHGRTWSSLPDFDLRVGDDPQLSLMHALAIRGYATYALDLRGYGESERNASGWSEPLQAAEDVATALAMIREREGMSVDLLGWSYGAKVAQLTLQLHPDAARKLVLYGYPHNTDATPKAGHAVGKARAPRPKKSTEAGAPPRKTNTAAAARSDFITPGTITEPAIQAFVDAALTADPTRADWRHGDQFDALDPTAISLPTLVIHGAGDPIARLNWQTTLFRNLGAKNRQWVVLPGTDHAAHLEDPKAFLRALLSFLDRENVERL